MNKIRHTPAVLSALIAAALLWGFSFVATKIALVGFDQYTLVFVRLLTAALFFLTLFIVRGFPRLDGKTHRLLLLIAFFEPVLYFLAETAGLSRTTAGKASLLIATIPAVVLVFSRVLLSEKMSARRGIGAFISICGVAVLVIGDPSLRLEGANTIVGDLLIVGAVLSGASYIVLTRRVSTNVSPVDVTGYQFVYGTAFFLPIYLASASRQNWSAIPMRSIGAILFLMFGATIGAFLCYNYALSKTEASRAAVFLNGIPIVAAVTGWILLGERMTPVQLAGAAVVLIGIYIVSRK